MHVVFGRSARGLVVGILLFGASLATLSACGSSGTALGAVATGTVPDEMRVGIVADYPPFAYLTASGDPDGLDAALAQEIARRLNRDVEWIDRPFPAWLGQCNVGV